MLQYVIGLFLLTSYADADLPVDCEHHQIIGSWTFEVGPLDQNKTVQCHTGTKGLEVGAVCPLFFYVFANKVPPFPKPGIPRYVCTNQRASNCVILLSRLTNMAAAT